MPYKDPAERRRCKRESEANRRAAKRGIIPQRLPAPVAVRVSEWAPDLENVALPLRSAADELRAYELAATIALTAPDDVFGMWCARARLVVVAAQGAGRIRETLALAAAENPADPKESFEYALAVANAKVHDEQTARLCEDHRLAIVAGLNPAPLEIESGYDKFGLGDPKWRK